MRLVRRAVYVLVAVLAAPVVLVGCRPGSALHSRYNNFRAYYNTYYNATQKLEEGELALQRQDAAVDRGVLVAVFPFAAASGGQSGPFQEAIDKSAELLRARPDSKWADDALLVIGKAYFYQRNIVGAEQKFRETMAAAEATGDRRLGDEARFWLGRTYAAAERYDDGVEVLEAGLAEEDVDRRWAARMQLALGELYARAGRWEEAAEALQVGAADVGDADLAARAYVLLGQVAEEESRWEEAAEAYAAALDQQPAYELAFAAEVSRALVLGLDAGETEAALAIIRRMRGDDKHYERRGELALVQARLLAAAGRDQAALTLFRDILYGEDLDARTVRGRAHYRLGEFYRDVRGDYIRAAAHFDTASTALPDLAAVARPSRAALVGVDDEARTYGMLAASARRVAEVDSLLALGVLPDEEFAQRIEEIEAERLRVYLEEQRRLEAERTAQAFSGGGEAPIDRRPQGEPVSGEGPPAALQTGASGAGAVVDAAEVGFLAYRDPSALLAGQIAFEQRWGDRPLVPNWRRQAAIQAGPVASEVGGVGRVNERTGQALAGGLPRLDLSKVPRTPAKREELVTELAGLRYELANAFFLSLGRADTAAALYRAILEDTPRLPVAVRAQYALAEIELAAGRADAARPLYEAVAQADTTGVLAEASRVRLGLADPVEPEVAVETSAAYDAARARWRAGSPREAAAELVAFADADPDALLAPRAYLAAAVAYIEWAEGDTLALTGPLPPDLVSSALRPVATADDTSGDEAPAFPEASSSDAGTSAAPAAQSGLNTPPPSEPDAPLLEEAPSPPVASPAPPAPAPPDSSAFALRDHLGALASLYPATPYAERALILAEALPAPPSPPAAADSLAADSLAADSLTAASADPFVPVPDSTATDELAVGEAAPDGPPAADSLPAPSDLADEEPPASVFGDAQVDPSAGGLSWRIQALDTPAEGDRMAQSLRSDGYPVTIAYDEAGGGYLLLVGQFGSVEEGEVTRSRLPAWAQVRAVLVPMDSLSVVEDGAEPRD